MRTLTALALAACLLTPGVAAAAPHAPAPHASPSSDWTEGGTGNGRGFTFAVIGDTPYGAEKIARFPQDVARINADTTLDALIHVGDIKNGSTRCTDTYNAWVRSQFDRFTMPFVYTPGDNEWTDCHRPSNGGYDPLERLGAIRSTFFANPGTTMGEPVKVASQTNLGVPENVSWTRAKVAFATLHVVGSNDGLAPWTGVTAPDTRQVADEKQRMDAAVAQVRAAYAQARKHHLRAVVLFQQADMFDGTYPGWKLSQNDAFLPLLKVLTEESNAFDGASYLIDGDSHVFTDDRPLAAGSPWLGRYGLTTPAPRLHRITVDGSDTADEYLRFTVTKAQPGSQDVLRYEHVSLVG